MSPQSSIAHYKIVSKLGEGGMGAVYRATDTKLHRDVAIKVLPESFARDPDRLARFTREAQLLAALNHPHIAAIYGVEDTAFVMELVEGESLRQVLERGPVPIETAMEYAAQIGEALEAAHDRGIVHRDLKPANIMVTPDGKIKVLDFGLAAVMHGPAAPAADANNSPTLTMQATQAGVILGTAGYMAPEQARGKPVDKRADIWAFGVVLYEMLTGKRLFQGEDVTETLASVVKDKPDLSVVPPEARRLVERCLEKDPRKRLRDIGDMRLLLDAPAPAPAVAQSGRWVWAVLALLTAALGVALWAPWDTEKAADNPLVQLDVDLGAGVSLPIPGASGANMAISPDATRLAYVSGSPTKLFIRRLDQVKATEIPGTESATLPFFSPDGQWVGFKLNSKIAKVSVEGGAVIAVGEAGAGNFAGVTWADAGSIVVSEAAGKGLVRMPVDGGKSEVLAPLVGGELALGGPRMLPGGRAILATGVTAFEADKSYVKVGVLPGPQWKTLVQGGASPRYISARGAGYLLYINKGTLFAVPFDLDQLTMRGTPVAVLRDLAYQRYTGTGQYDVSAAPGGHGTLVYQRTSGIDAQLATLEWDDPAGKKQAVSAKPDVYHALSLSPDGKLVALSIGSETNAGIWEYDLARDTMTRLTFGDSSRIYDSPLWSPDGQHVIFQAFGTGLVQARADGVGPPQALVENKDILIPGAFTPDGKTLAYNALVNGNTQIWIAPVEEQGGELKTGKPERLDENRFFEYAQGFSPDGRWLAYESNETGKFEVYVRSFPPSEEGGKWQVSQGGGREPVWPQRGHDLLYRSGQQIMAASYTVKGETFVPETPRVWIPKLSGTVWDVARDGQRALVLVPQESALPPAHEVVLMFNFLDELRRRVPMPK